MAITDEDKQYIKQSFAKLDLLGQEFAHCFVDLLFEVAPMLKPMFVTNRNLLEQHFYVISQAQ